MGCFGIQTNDINKEYIIDKNNQNIDNNNFINESNENNNIINKIKINESKLQQEKKT